MSIAIDHDSIVGVYAFGEWYEVDKGSFDVDAYELLDPASSTHSKYWYALGKLFYPEEKHAMTGATWLTPGTHERVSMPLFEIKAYKEKRS